MVACPRCHADLGDPPPLACPNCGMIFAPSHQLTNPATQSGPPLSSEGARNCPNCKSPMTNAGQISFRVGGYVGGAGLFLGGWNQLAENLQPFSVYHCPTCGKVDLYEVGR